jgi:hypothetical protein
MRAFVFSAPVAGYELGVSKLHSNAQTCHAWDVFELQH